MLSSLLAGLNNLPDIWGEGAIFAFSGMDGTTCAASQFVATFGAQPYDLLIHTPLRRVLEIRPADTGKVRIASGDVLAVDTARGDLVLTYSAWHTLVGVLPDDCALSLHAEGFAPPDDAGPYETIIDGEHNDAITFSRRENRFVLAYGQSEDEALERAERGLHVDVFAEAAQRCAAYRTLPKLPSALMDRLLKKCFSVMRVNTLSKEAAIQQAWSTPDRVPHKDMWLWDSVFHSLAMNRINPRLSWDFLKSVLDVQKPDGMIPHQTSVTGRSSSITQPPLLAWGVWENYQVLKDASCLAYALPRLERYLDWDCAQRDANHNGLLEWFIEGNVNCRSGESGLDNSPRFDEALLVDAVDFSTFAAQDMCHTARIAREMGDASKACHWQARAEALSAKIHSYLWDEETGFYYDRRIDGRRSRVRAVSGFFPLLLDDIPAQHVEGLVKALLDPAHFNTPFPAPSVAVSDAAWSTDLWRGGTWVNTNYLVARGLAKHGRGDLAAWLAQKTITYILKYYERYGVLFEFFDATDQRPPVACDRKGPRREPYNIRVKMDSIRDYHWTAALTALMLMDQT